MSEPENTQDVQRKPSFLRKAVVLACVSLLSALGGFAVPYFVLAKNSSASASASSETAKPAFIPFGETVVNLDEGRLNRYLRMSITVQVAEEELPEITKRVEKRKAILKSWLLSYLSDKSMEEIRGAAGQNRLRREILENFNAVLSDDNSDVIHDVLFEEFNIQ
jgi:flagellar basal body-associated protein FliL